MESRRSLDAIFSLSKDVRLIIPDTDSAIIWTLAGASMLLFCTISKTIYKAQ